MQGAESGWEVSGKGRGEDGARGRRRAEGGGRGESVRAKTAWAGVRRSGPPHPHPAPDTRLAQ